MSDKPIAEMTALELERKRLELMERQIALQESQAASLATQVERTAPKENPNYVPTGPTLQPSGEPWAKSLPYAVFLGSTDLRRTPMTQAETEWVARIRSTPAMTIRKVDNSIVRGSVVATQDAHGRIEAMRIVLPLNKDSNPQHYPPLIDLARQIVSQAEAVG